ncbi:MAG: UvrD-helicase domain-containing protein, partial [bacterium]
MDILSSLNESQRQAVLATEGPVLILAGAGSGKTRALTHRVAHLISEGVSTQNILAVTFTNKAAQVMSERINKLLSENKKSMGAKLPWLGTFHSICVKILRREVEQLGYGRDFSIYDQDDSLRLIKQIMKSLAIDEKRFNPRAIRSYISGAKGELIDAKGYESFAFDQFQERVAKVFKEYEKKLKVQNALDFDDLISKTVELFRKFPEVLSSYQNRFKYILVDEYQDTNHSQYILLKLLAARHKNIFAIGDDWQSIYSFRGAKFQNILDFKKDYPQAKIVYLEENYRSRAPILASAQALIKNNELRSDKNIFTSKSGGSPVLVVSSGAKHDEIEFIIDEIGSLKAGERRGLRDFVVLYRINAQSRAFEESLVSRGIPYKIIGGVRFYERREIKDIIAYLRYAINPKDTVSLSRIVNVPTRGIGDKTLQVILSDIEKAKDNPKFANFLKIISRLQEQIDRGKSPDLLVGDVLNFSGYKEFLNDGTVESQTRLENIEELKNAASSFETITDFLESVALVSDTDNFEEDRDYLTLMTVHS